MFLDLAVGSLATGSGAGIVTAVAHAGLTVGTICIYLALVAVATNQGCGITGQAVGTNASGLSVAGHHAVSIGSTRIGIANGATGFTASLISISHISGATVALLTISSHIAVGIFAARSWLTKLNGNSRLVAQPERISNLVVRTVADGLTR